MPYYPKTKNNRTIVNLSALMAHTYHDNRGPHYKEDVITHTTDVVERIKKMNPSKRLLIAAYLHDIGKPFTVSKKGDIIRFIGHDKVGANISRSILVSYPLKQNEIDDISTLIEYHMRMNTALSNLIQHKNVNALSRLILKFIRMHKKYLLPDLVKLSIADMKVDYNPSLLINVINELPAKSENDSVLAQQIKQRLKTTL